MFEADIIRQQETNWEEECLMEVEKEWMGELHVNNGGSKARRVDIFVQRGVAENVEKCADGGDGRVIGIAPYMHRMWRKRGRRLVGWIRKMYDTAASRVKINGIVTDTFRLERSVRQGCPLSALLYSQSAEPLAALLMQNERIKDMELPGGQVSTLYQYADVTTVTVRDKEMYWRY